MIHHSPLPDVDIPDLPLTEYVLAGGAGQPDKPALIDGASGRVMTYGELGSAVRSLAGGLAAAGFGPGDVLALLAPNGPEYAVAFHGAAMAGGTITTINPAYTQAEVHHQLADSGCSAIPPGPDPAAELRLGSRPGGSRLPSRLAEPVQQERRRDPDGENPREYQDGVHDGVGVAELRRRDEPDHERGHR
jgi:non-ribosomal peptide synthetase component F